MVTLESAVHRGSFIGFVSDNEATLVAGDDHRAMLIVRLKVRFDNGCSTLCTCVIMVQVIFVGC